MNVFEKFRAEHPDPDFVMHIIAANPGDPGDKIVLFIGNGRGKDVLAITADGQMHFAPGYSPTQQAEAFRQAVNMMAQRAIFPLLPEPDVIKEPDDKPPNWYSEDEMYHWLTRDNYSEQIARELAKKIAYNYQLAFNKGYEIGKRRSESK